MKELEDKTPERAAINRNHVAGPYCDTEHRQRCVLCGGVIYDVRDYQNAVAPEGQDSSPSRGWVEGPHFIVRTSPHSVQSGCGEHPELPGCLDAS